MLGVGGFNNPGGSGGGGGPPTGPAGGDLSGTYPNPTVIAPIMRGAGFDSLQSSVGAVANGFRSIAFSNGATAAGSGSTAFGSNSSAGGEHSVALGDSAQANGTQTVSIGFAAQVGAQQTIALGSLAYAGGTSSIAFGINAQTTLAGVINCPAIPITKRDDGTYPHNSLPIGQNNAAAKVMIWSDLIDSVMSVGLVSAPVAAASGCFGIEVDAFGLLTVHVGATDVSLLGNMQTGDSVTFSNFSIGGVDGTTQTVLTVGADYFTCATALAEFTLDYETRVSATISDTTSSTNGTNTSTSAWIATLNYNVMSIDTRTFSATLGQSVAFADVPNISNGIYSVSEATGTEFQIVYAGSLPQFYIFSPASLTFGGVLLGLPSGAYYLPTDVIVLAQADGAPNCTVDVGVSGDTTRYATALAVGGNDVYSTSAVAATNKALLNTSPIITITNNGGTGKVRVGIECAVLAPQ